MHPIIGRLIVNFVLCLICFIAYSSQIFIIWPWYGRVISVDLLVLLVPFNTLVAMLLWNYFLCVVTDPGQVPDSWQPDIHSEGYEVKKLTGGPRFCRMCQKFKPPRTHHCRQCKRCVLRMDHHCPWVNNCIGHFNYGHFIRFLFYVDLACSYHLIMVTRRVFFTMGPRYWDEPSGLELVFIILNYVACIPVILSVGAFSLFHFYSLLGNTTTIEGWEKDKVATMVRRGKIREVKFPYNLGSRRNIESVLGVNPLWWCWPTVTPGTGLKYQLAEDDGKWVELSATRGRYEGGGTPWPPHDPKASKHEDPDRGFTLPTSPWTYENGSLNPNLEPSNAHLRSASSKRRNNEKSSLPPYHPDYQDEDLSYDNGHKHSSDESETFIEGEDDGEHQGNRRTLVRRGSEGYEVRPVGREEMLRRYLEELGEEPTRYVRYISEPDSNSEGREDESSAVHLESVGD